MHTYNRWNDIENIEIEVLENVLVPVHMTLTWNSGGVVTSAGWSISDAAVLLFSTAGFGRHAPRALNNKIERMLGDSIDKKWVNTLISVLSECTCVR
jgi:hypothetical protein